VKFGQLWRRARELGASHLATGHYARITTDASTGRLALRTAVDSAKDQTYFLFALDHVALGRTLFPIGDLTKSDVRAHARALGLAVADKPESMEVCFVPDGDAAAFVERHATRSALRPGRVVDDDGRLLGTHDGVHRFTVGQRRGLGLGGGPRRYVRAIDGTAGTVTVGGPSSLVADGLVARETVWTGGAAPAAGTRMAVRIRHRHRPVAGWLASAEDDAAEIRFVGPGPLVTPGQAAVFYRDDVVLGGGWIARELAGERRPEAP
jgi:tRNA-specific 2-thiouridylase